MQPKKPFRWTVVELPTFRSQALRFWSEDDVDSVIDHIAAKAPENDFLIPESDGCWKSRKTIGNSGTRKGARLIYYIDHEKDRIFLLTVYRKSELANIPGSSLAKIVRQIK